MCGISGYVSATGDFGGKDLPGLVARMNNALARRGPDAEGLKTWKSAVLGHRRLAILDLSERGAQPMTTEDGSIGVTFNGCIYNFVEIRNELEAGGVSFASMSDTEVIVKGVREWGVPRLVDRLRGMYAFAVWNDKTGHLTLVRDRLGVKPLAYWRDGNGGLAFASTVSALRAADCTGEIDETAIVEYLRLGFIPDHLCVYQGVHKLPPGAILEWDAGKLSIESYWSPPKSPLSRTPMKFDEAAAQTESLFLDAVRIRLQADVPMGALLSSGIDSALVCWAALREKPDLTAFTVGAPGDPEDETAGARETANVLGMRHELVTLPRDQSVALDELVKAYSEPFACSSALAMIRVARAVKSSATVLLTGDGADDVYLGYDFFRSFYLSQAMARATPDALLRLWPSVRPAFESSRLKRAKHFFDYASGGLSAVLDVRDGLKRFEKAGLLGKELCSENGAAPTSEWESPFGRELLDDLIEYAQGTWFTGEFLTKVDGGSMYYAIEARSPFLDHRLWEFAGRLPYPMRLHRLRLKSILRKLAERHVGRAVATREKRGFSIPVGRWLAGIWRESLVSLRQGSPMVERGWVDPAALRAEIDAALEKSEASQELWRLVVLDKWLKAQSG